MVICVDWLNCLGGIALVYMNQEWREGLVGGEGIGVVICELFCVD